MTTKKPTKKPTTRKPREVAIIAASTTRDLWFGWTTDPDATPLVLRRARHIFYYSSASCGIGGVASRGVFAGSKIGPECAEVRMRLPAGVLVCSPESVRAFAEVTPWVG